MVSFRLFHSTELSWSEVVLELLEFGQRLGGGWLIIGDIRHEVSAVLAVSDTSKSAIDGLDWAEWQVLQTTAEQDVAGNPLVAQLSEN